MKSIVITSDGTGKRGGILGHDTNVFRIYRSVDLQADDQIAYYDDGIGAYTNKWMKSVISIFGFGFSHKVLGLYKYLAKHYEPGDKIYLFGFSRGSATVRALSGFIQEMGLIRNDIKAVLHNDVIDDVRLHFECLKALLIYKRRFKHPETVIEFREEKAHVNVEIEMMGIWDTVSVFGFPQDSTYLLIGFSKFTEWLAAKIFPHGHFNYQLNSNVKAVYHALSIDDDRHTFSPKLWNELADERPEHIEQVWFSGDHGNVGGGRARTGLSSITLDWMMEKAQNHGLRFDYDSHDIAKRDSNRGGLINNPRSGFGVVYRIKHRHIKNLSSQNGESILEENIKIHKSVLDRIKLVEYHPILPNKFDVVDNDGFIESIVDESHRTRVLKNRVNKLMNSQIWLYHIFLESLLAVLLFSTYLYHYGESHFSPSSIYNQISAYTPGFFENFLYYCTHIHPLVGIIIAGAFASMFVARIFIKKWILRIRNEINSRLKPLPLSF